MFQVTCKGRSLSELKKSVEAALAELHGEVGAGSVDFKMPATPAIKDEEYVDESEISTHSNVAHIQQVTPAVDMNELDSKGMPWIKGLHSSSKAKVKDGSWKYARGTTDAQIAQAEASYKSAQPVQAPVAAAPVQQPVQQPVQAPVQQITPPPMPQQMGTGHTLETFCANFPMIIGTLVQKGTITSEYVGQLNSYFNVDQIWKLNDQQKALVFNDFVTWGYVTKVG